MPRSLTCIVWGALSLALAGLLLDAAWLEPSSLRVNRYEVPLDAPALKGVTIAVISDLHAGAPYIDEKKIDQIVAMANAAKPDLILLTGDYVIGHVLGGRYMPAEIFVKHLRRLRAPLGVYAVLGNHEYYDDPLRIAALFRASGIPVLENAHVTLATPKGPLDLVGIDDFHTDHSDLDEALGHVPAGRRALCFTHSPDVFPELPRSCALTMAGHTHGGQIWLPLLGRPAVGIGVSKYGQRYAIGLIREKDKVLFVSSGIGTSGLPLRLGVPPEIALLTLR